MTVRSWWADRWLVGHLTPMPGGRCAPGDKLSVLKRSDEEREQGGGKIKCGGVVENEWRWIDEGCEMVQVSSGSSIQSP
jgi:hypothetical protein